jgi:integrase
MQHGSLALVSRKEGPDVWQFRWSEKDLHGARIQRKRVIGTIERYPDEAATRTAMTIVFAELNSGKARIRCGSISVAQLCDHFEQRELTVLHDNLDKCAIYAAFWKATNSVLVAAKRWAFSSR